MRIARTKFKKIGTVASYFGVAIFLFLYFISVQAQSNIGAKLYFIPSSGSYEVGKTFSIRLAVESTSQTINLVESNLSFSNKLIEVTSLSKDGSIITFWFDEPKFSNSAGTVSFSGGIPNPGFSGTGRVLIINFKVKAAGSGWIKIASAQTLANDGEGTNILASNGSVNLTLYDSGLPKPIPTKISTPTEGPQIKITSSTHPEQQKWYAVKNITLNWTWQQGITDFSYVLDKNSSTIPDNTAEGLNSSISYNNVQDGVWYFHLKAKANNQWSKVFHYKLQIDTEKPIISQVEILPQRECYQPDPTIKVLAEDKLSGIGSLEVKIDNENFIKSSNNSEYILPKQNPGSHTAIIKICDLANNCFEATENFTIKLLPAPRIVRYTKKMLFADYPDTLIFEGTSIPLANINLFFTYENGQQFLTSAQTNDLGKWSLMYKEMIPVGKYTAMAVATLEGQESQPATNMNFEVIRTGIMISDWIVIPENAVWSIIIFLISLIGILITVILFLTRRFKRLNHFIQKLMNKKNRAKKVNINKIC